MTLSVFKPLKLMIDNVTNFTTVDLFNRNIPARIVERSTGNVVETGSFDDCQLAYVIKELNETCDLEVDIVVLAQNGLISSDFLDVVRADTHVIVQYKNVVASITSNDELVFYLIDWPESHHVITLSDEDVDGLSSIPRHQLESILTMPLVALYLQEMYVTSAIFHLIPPTRMFGLMEIENIAHTHAKETYDLARDRLLIYLQHQTIFYKLSLN